MIFSAESRARVREAERLWIAKLVLRVVTLVLVLVAIGLVASSIAFLTSSPYSLPSGYSQIGYRSSVDIAWPLIPLGISAGWNLANIIVRLSRARPMHPGANVGMDLILWMGLATTATLLLFSAMENMRYSDYSSYNYTYVNGVLVPDSNCSPYFSCAAQDAYMAQIKRLGNDELSGTILTYIATLLHLALFAWSCHDTRTRNSNRTTTIATAIAEKMIHDMQEKGLLVAPLPMTHAAHIHHSHNHSPSSRSYSFSSHNYNPEHHNHNNHNQNNHNYNPPHHNHNSNNHSTTSQPHNSRLRGGGAGTLTRDNSLQATTKIGTSTFGLRTCRTSYNPDYAMRDWIDGLAGEREGFDASAGVGEVGGERRSREIEGEGTGGARSAETKSGDDDGDIEGSGGGGGERSEERSKKRSKERDSGRIAGDGTGVADGGEVQVVAGREELDGKEIGLRHYSADNPKRINA